MWKELQTWITFEYNAHNAPRNSNEQYFYLCQLSFEHKILNNAITFHVWWWVLWNSRKGKQKLMKEELQTWITFKILWCNWIFASLRIKDTLLKVLKLSFRLGNADLNSGTPGKYWNRNTLTKSDVKRTSNMNYFWI